MIKSLNRLSKSTFKADQQSMLNGLNHENSAIK